MSKDDHIRNVSTKQDRIAGIAEKYFDQPILSIAHFIDLEWLYVAYLKTRKDGALGIDQQDATSYANNLHENLKRLLNKLKSGNYRAPAVRRVYIPKGKRGEVRPLGIPTFEDKILQRAILMVLSPVWEQEFYNFSYGFREGKNTHQALKALREICSLMKGCWVIDLDIRNYFDTIDHGLLRNILKQRVCDGVIIKVIGKWLKAGVLEAGTIKYRNEGTPQGGVISPLLSNIFLHEVLDKWFVEIVQPRLRGRSGIVRFADDSVLIFEKKEDAVRVLRVLYKRFEKYKLTLHPHKTQLVDFRSRKDEHTGNKPGTFSFLGFTFYWGKSRKGKRLIKWKTEKSRLSRSIMKVHDWLKRNRHLKLREQAERLSRMIMGHYAYYGMSFNTRSLALFFYQCKINWFKWLKRRSQRNHMTWEKFRKILNHYPLPNPRIVHSLWSEALT